jgi:hypothetical protein
MIRRLLLILCLGILFFSNVSWRSPVNNQPKPSNENFESYAINIYKELNDKELNFKAFNTALKGFVKISAKRNIHNLQYLTIIDMSISANKNRFFLIDLKNKRIIHKSIVAHGRNSGGEFAKYFSNIMGSYQSSIGFYKTAETYHGKHGLSLRLDGLEQCNNNARKRAIVIHSADYVSKNFIDRNGRLGRSFGCPALPKKDFSKIIEKIKNGSVLFIYYPNDNYFENSILANSNFSAEKYLTSH